MGGRVGDAGTYLLDLHADEVTSRDVSVAELFDELLTLSALAAARTTADEGDLGVSELSSDVESASS